MHGVNVGCVECERKRVCAKLEPWRQCRGMKNYSCLEHFLLCFFANTHAHEYRLWHGSVFEMTTRGVQVANAVSYALHV